MMTAVDDRIAQTEEFHQVAPLRWRWLIEEDDGIPTTGYSESIAYFVDWARLSQQTHTCFVAAQDSEVIGMAWLTMLAREPSPRSLERLGADLQSVYIVPDHRSRGIGRTLIETVLSAAYESGIERAVVHSSPGAITAYERADFAPSPRLMETAVTAVD